VFERVYKEEGWTKDSSYITNFQNISNVSKNVLNEKVLKIIWGKIEHRTASGKLKNKYTQDVLETKNLQVIEALIGTAVLTLIRQSRS